MKSIAVVTDKTAVQYRNSMLLTALCFVFALFAGCEMTPDRDAATAQPGQNGDDSEEFFIVDCLLPGQVRKLGGNFSYVTQRRPIKTAQSDCEIRGGEYVSYDRADYSTALRIWLPLAQAGDPAAQTYVGEIYEKGLGLSADYQVAAHWYSEAARLGYSRAQINLGHLYEKGLGVEQDKQQALNLYRSASGLGADNLLFASTLSSSYVPRQDYESVQRALTQEQYRSDQLRRKMSRVSDELSKQSAVLTDAEEQLHVTEARLKQAIAARSAAGKVTPDQAASAHEQELQANVEQMESYQRDLELQMTQLTRQNSELTRSQQALVEQLSAHELTKSRYLQQIEQLERQTSLSMQDLNRSEQELAVAQQKLSEQQSREESRAPQLIGLQRDLNAKNQALTEEQVKLAQLDWPSRSRMQRYMVFACRSIPQ